MLKQPELCALVNEKSLVLKNDVIRFPCLSVLGKALFKVQDHGGGIL